MNRYFKFFNFYYVKICTNNVGRIREGGGRWKLNFNFQRSKIPKFNIVQKIHTPERSEEENFGKNFIFNHQKSHFLKYLNNLYHFFGLDSPIFLEKFEFFTFMRGVLTPKTPFLRIGPHHNVYLCNAKIRCSKVGWRGQKKKNNTTEMSNVCCECIVLCDPECSF